MAQSANTSPLHDLTAFQRDLLAVIVNASEPLYGLAIREELGDAYEEQINHGRLYPNLDTLAEMGLVEKDDLDARTNEYRVTARGEREYQADIRWRADE